MFNQLKTKFPLYDNRWSNYISYFKRIEVSAKTTILKEDEISKKLFLIEQGCIRAWHNNNGKDLTFQFFFENSTVASIESFRKEIPSIVSLEVIEPSVIWWIYKNDMSRIIDEIKNVAELRDMLINGLFERSYDYMKQFFSFIKDTPEQRYINLLTDRPEIVQRIPQHYIASYLGISSVHLSRIKSKLARNKG